MEKEKVLEIEFQPVWDKWAWKVTKQNEEILKRNEFIDKELNVESFHSPEFGALADLTVEIELYGLIRRDRFAIDLLDDHTGVDLVTEV